MLRQFAQFTVATALVSSACGAAEQDGPWAIYGHIVSTAGATEGWVVFDYSGISALYCSENDIPKNARKLRHNGYIFPSLIDAHNHAHWNALPQWRAGRKFNSRYEWLVDSEYQAKVNKVFDESIH